MTDMEEKQMIEQAKAGDPKAQFEMSQWARQMSILEPNEERWNRLAAKCLVDAAQAGYEPAKIMVQQLISGQSETPEPEKPDTAEEKTMRYVPAAPENRFAQESEIHPPAEPERRFYDQAEEADYDADEPYDGEKGQSERSFAAVLEKVAAAVKKGAAVAAAAAGALVATIRDKGGKSAPARRERGEDEAASRRRSSSRPGILGAFSDWVEDNWPVVRIVCVAACVVLAVLIVVLLIPPKQAEPEPTPEVIATPVPTPEPTPEPFPNEATVLEISSTSTLLYRPGDSDASAYLPASTSFTVQAEVETDDGENLRQGPSAYDYPDVIMRIANGTKVTAYASYTNSDGIVWYLINSGGVWGWMYGASLS